MSATIHPALVAAVRMTTDQLTDRELNALYMAMLLEQNPKPVTGYDKAKSLFTEQNETRMHHDTGVAFGAIWQERLGT